MRVEDTLDGEDYDEFAWLGEIGAGYGLPPRSPAVRRRRYDLDLQRWISALQWGEGEPEMALLHGGSQNAHTWDAMLLDLDRPALAIDLPGHGRSSRSPDANYGALRNADALADLLPRVAPQARIVIGMSLGALTAIRLASLLGPWIDKLVLVDATPPVDDVPINRSRAAERGIADTQRLPRYETFDGILAVAQANNPRRTRESVAREARLNAVRLEDGGWSWRFDVAARRPQDPANWAEMLSLWEDVDRIRVPTMLVRAQHSRFVSDANVAMLRQRLPEARVEVMPDSGHAIQTDQPRALAALIRDFCFT